MRVITVHLTVTYEDSATLYKNEIEHELKHKLIPLPLSTFFTENGATANYNQYEVCAAIFVCICGFETYGFLLVLRG